MSTKDFLPDILFGMMVAFIAGCLTGYAYFYARTYSPTITFRDIPIGQKFYIKEKLNAKDRKIKLSESHYLDEVYMWRTMRCKPSLDMAEYLDPKTVVIPCSPDGLTLNPKK
jgi:hypothetical protein